MPTFVKKTDSKEISGSSVKVQKKKKKVNPATLAIIGIFICMVIVTVVTVLGNRSVEVITAANTIEKGESIQGQTNKIIIPKKYAESISAAVSTSGYASKDIVKGDIIKSKDVAESPSDIKEEKELHGSTINFKAESIKTKVIEGEVKILILNATESKIMSGRITAKGEIIEFNTIASASPFMHGDYSVYIYTPDTALQEVKTNIEAGSEEQQQEVVTLN